jgi:hypothetical protein
MTARDETTVRDRLRRALLTFQTGQGHLLAAHRKLKGLSESELAEFWAGPGLRMEKGLHAAAAEVEAAFKAFSAAGLVANAADRHQVTEARRHIADGG